MPAETNAARAAEIVEVWMIGWSICLSKQDFDGIKVAITAALAEAEARGRDLLIEARSGLHAFAPDATAETIAKIDAITGGRVE